MQYSWSWQALASLKNREHGEASVNRRTINGRADSCGNSKNTFPTILFDLMFPYS
jgi:hypothetical protein